jgi:hypothetical protein
LAFILKKIDRNITPFIKLVGDVTTVASEVASLYFLCKTLLNNLNRKVCVRHFNAKVDGFNLHFEKEAKNSSEM